MPETREQCFVARYTYQRPTVERQVHRRQHYIVLQALVPGFPERRFMVKDEAVIPALLEQHVPLEVVEEVVTERETEAGWYDRVAAFHRSLPEDLREFVTIDGWNTGTARTPTMLGVGEHDRRKAHLEAFFHRERLAFTVECGSEFSENACRPLSRERIAALTGMVVA